MVSAMSVLLLICFFISVAADLDSSTNDTIVFSSARSTIGTGIIRAQRFYTKYMAGSRFDLTAASATFVKIPGLIVSVNHDTPILYKIWFSAGCYMTSSTASSSFVHFVVDDWILIGNKLLPNTGTRLAYGFTLGDSLTVIDAHGASYLRSSDSPGTYYTCSKYELVYLPPGLHVIEAAVRTEHPSLLVHSGTLTVELTQYETSTNIGLDYPSKP